jgi:hypothetical protein
MTVTDSDDQENGGALRSSQIIHYHDLALYFCVMEPTAIRPRM